MAQPRPAPLLPTPEALRQARIKEFVDAWHNDARFHSDCKRRDQIIERFKIMVKDPDQFGNYAGELHHLIPEMIHVVSNLNHAMGNFEAMLAGIEGSTPPRSS